MTARTHPRTPLTLTLIVALIVFGCALPLAPDTDQFEDASVALQSKMEAFFDELERTAGTEEGGWAKHASFYEGVRADLDLMRIEAGAHPRDAATRRVLELLAVNLASLEAAHREGLTPPEVPILRNLIGTQLRMFVELQKKAEAPSRGRASS